MLVGPVVVVMAASLLGIGHCGVVEIAEMMTLMMMMDLVNSWKCGTNHWRYYCY